MIGIAEDNECSRTFDLFGSQGFDIGEGSHRHKTGGGYVTVGSVHDSGTGTSMRALSLKSKRNGWQGLFANDSWVRQTDAPEAYGQVCARQAYPSLDGKGVRAHSSGQPAPYPDPWSGSTDRDSPPAGCYLHCPA